ncbi:MAG TPA: M23 family metallopeptidase [Spirochaetales bacterium]|nr:M23 family metallopeptidase [Spirochaetales bacterium]HRY53559.1 M23 family metallopeptidase [Spirochaetia bacterium]HRZ63379.1 M23 family metallopeptidase [Spirochaetia bacterium]
MRGAGALLLPILALVGTAQAQGQAYPRLGSLGPDDYVFKQHQEQLAASYEAVLSGEEAPELVFFAYTVRPRPAQKSGEEVKGSADLLSLAARLNLPYESLATLNGLDRAREFLPGERVLVPSIAGLFVPERPSSDLELLISYRGLPSGSPLSVGGRRLLFYPGARFNPEERALFLGLLFRFPLPAGRLTSGFGPRASPFTGKQAMHNGIDLAAPEGTEVYAAREGLVVESGTDGVLGEYLVLSHAGGMSTVYGHLSARRARLNDRVESGMIIGNVGSTGLSTGPHLHFEVRNRGEPRDPEPLIPRGKR